MSKVTLSAIGLTSQESTVVNVAANLLAALDHSIKVLDAGDSSGDIVLINPGSEAGRAVLGSLGGVQRAVLFVDNEAEANGSAALTRPVRVQTLLDLLTELVRHPPERTALRMPLKAAVAKTDSHASAATMPGNLFYLLLDAVLNRTLLSVRCNGSDSTVLIHGPTQAIYTRLDGMTLEKLAQQAAEKVSASKLGESDFMQATRGMSLTRLHDVIWLAERHGARGLLLTGHSLDIPVRLKVWPKFNSRHVRPDYLKLAALLSKQPLTLRALAETSGVPLQHVIDFYNTSVAFGVIDNVVSAPVAIPPKASNTSGLLGKIAKRLALKKD